MKVRTKSDRLSKLRQGVMELYLSDHPAGDNEMHRVADAVGLINVRYGLEKLGKKQDKDGAVRGAATSITRSGGEALEIETTALALLAWLRSPAHTARCESAMGWLLERCKGVEISLLTAIVKLHR